MSAPLVCGPLSRRGGTRLDAHIRARQFDSRRLFVCRVRGQESRAATLPTIARLLLERGADSMNQKSRNDATKFPVTSMDKIRYRRMLQGDRRRGSTRLGKVHHLPQGEVEGTCYLPCVQNRTVANISVPSPFSSFRRSPAEGRGSVCSGLLYELRLLDVFSSSLGGGHSSGPPESKRLNQWLILLRFQEPFLHLEPAGLNSLRA